MALNANALKVSQRAAGANMSVDIAAGDAHLELPSTSYSFWCWTDAVTNLAFAAASTTNPRYDTVVAWVDTTVTTTANVNSPGSFKFKVIAGTAAGSPSVLSDSAIQSNLGAGIAWVRLADVLRPVGVDNVSNSNITDTRVPTRLKVSASAKAIELSGLNGGSAAGMIISDSSGNVSVSPGAWEEVGRTTVTAVSSSAIVVNLPVDKRRKEYRVTAVLTRADTASTQYPRIQLNGDTGNSYYFRGIDVSGSATSPTTANTFTSSAGETYMTNSGGESATIHVTLTRATSSSWWTYTMQSSGSAGFRTGGGNWQNVNEITSIQLSPYGIQMQVGTKVVVEGRN